MKDIKGVLAKHIKDSIEREANSLSDEILRQVEYEVWEEIALQMKDSQFAMIGGRKTDIGDIPLTIAAGVDPDDPDLNSPFKIFNLVDLVYEHCDRESGNKDELEMVAKTLEHMTKKIRDMK